MLVLTKNGEIKEKDSYELESISSRGNGRYGLQLNPYALSGVKVNYPTSISSEKINSFLDYLPDEFEIRGEAVIPKNEHTYKKYGKEAVWRNIASGMFNRIIPFNLNGVIKYLYGEEETSETISFDRNKYLLEPEFQGRKCINPKVYENAKLIASLFEDRDNYKGFSKGDKLLITPEGKVIIYYSDETKEEFIDDGEELDIIMYSISVDNSNIDLNDLINSKNEQIFNSLGFKTIKDVQFQKQVDYHLRTAGYGPTFRITSNRKFIHDAVNEFYGIWPEINKERWCQEFPRLRNMYEYACDGVVVKPVGSNKNTQNTDLRLGRNNKIVSPEYPEDQIAIKLLSEIVRVKLVHIECNETKIGNVTCTGILDKGYKTESGAIVSSINLHNPEWLAEHSWIKEGEEYDMCMVMDIIPTLMNPNL